MYSRQVEQLARQRNAELASRTGQPQATQPRGVRPQVARPLGRRPQPSGHRQHTRASLRRNTGWAIVAIGLRIAESGNKRAPVATCHPH